MLLWCKAGKGIVTVNGKSYDFCSGNFLFIPWNHIIRYHADTHDPFWVAGIHIIPDYSDYDKIVYSVFHSPQAENPEYQKRKDIYLKGFSDIFSGRLNENSRLLLLAEYIVNWFKSEPRLDNLAHSLAESLIYELNLIQNKAKNTGLDLPLSLNKILFYVEQNIQRSIHIDTLTQLAECSRPTLFRLFRRYFHCTPGNWLWRKKMEHATQLLLKSNLRIGEIASAIGVNDPYYFSRLFRKHHGMTAREYRNRNSLTPVTPIH